MNSSRSGRSGVSHVALRRRLATAVLALGVMSCGSQDPMSAPSLARGGGSTGAKGPTVSATNPRFAARGVTLNVQVTGSGFSPGDRAVWALKGDTTFAVTRIKVNSTTYVSATQLTANVTLGADAQVDLYDVVVVTLAGKKGIGIEMFEVTLEIIDLGLGDGSVATGINGNAQIVGRSSGGAFVWEGGVITYLQRLPGAAGAQAEDINAGGAIVGTSGSRAVVWKPRSGGGYDPPVDLGTLGGCCSEALAINDDGTIAGDSRLPGDAVSHAVYWDSDGQIHDIQTVQGGESFTWGVERAGIPASLSVHRRHRDGAASRDRWRARGRPGYQYPGPGRRVERAFPWGPAACDAVGRRCRRRFGNSWGSQQRGDCHDRRRSSGRAERDRRSTRWKYAIPRISMDFERRNEGARLGIFQGLQLRPGVGHQRQWMDRRREWGIQWRSAGHLVEAAGVLMAYRRRGFRDRTGAPPIGAKGRAYSADAITFSSMAIGVGSRDTSTVVRVGRLVAKASA
jgi:hypothetical protein